MSLLIFIRHTVRVCIFPYFETPIRSLTSKGVDPAQNSSRVLSTRTHIVALYGPQVFRLALAAAAETLWLCCRQIA